MFTRLNRLDLAGYLAQPHFDVVHLHHIKMGHGVHDEKLWQQGPLGFDAGGAACV